MTPDNLDRWRPELRRAVMRTRPDFFAWPPEQQKHYGIAMPEEDRARLDEALLAELFGRSCATGADATAAADSLAPDEQDLWNEVVLPLYGIGEDCFCFNESFAAGQTILDFETLRDCDEADHRFQEEARKRDDPGYAGRPYRGSLYLAWARLFVDGRFTYATLSMAAGYLYAQLHEAAEALLERRIPHRYVPGKDHGKVEGESWQWDLRVDANGEEGVLEELKRRTWDYEFKRWDELSTAYDVAHPPGVYFFDESKEPSGACTSCSRTRKPLPPSGCARLCATAARSGARPRRSTRSSRTSTPRSHASSKSNMPT
jgi:hypothetical protein